jgi:sugar lactone lactonase YvrE
MEQGRGNLYRIDADLTVHRMDTGISMSNGIGWSPDDRVMYYADSRPGRIWRYDFDLESGEIRNRRVFVDYADRQGRPDGLTVDADGFVWVAEVTASRVARYDPDGSVDRVVTLPLSRPTSVIFGGADLRTLYITSMRAGLETHELDAEPLAGAVLSIETDTRGRPEPLFAG